MSDEKEVGVLLPKALDLTPLGGISFKEHLAVGSILTVDEGSVTSKRIPLDQLKAKAVDELPSPLPWTHFAEKTSQLEEANLVPTIVMGRGALLVRQVVDQGTVAKVFSTVNDIGTNPLDLSATSSSVESLLQQEQQQQRLIQHLNSFLPQNLFQLHQQQQQQHVLLQQQQRALGLGPSTAPQPGRRAREKTMLPCQICGKAFDRPSLLKRHMRTHTGEKPHICEVCNKGFSTSSSLNTHRRIHSGEKPHQCGICGKRFTASSNLYYHKMTHNKEKPHKCPHCDKTFPTPGELKAHQTVHSTLWPMRCHICNQGFAKAVNLRNHILGHLTGLPVPMEPETPSLASLLAQENPNTATSTAAETLTSQQQQSTLALTCPVCKESLPSLAIFQLHLRTHLLMMQQEAQTDTSSRPKEAMMVAESTD